MKILTLYTTLGCHLCEEAKQVIWPLLQPLGYRLEEVDIADSELLMQQYGVRIPVVKCANRESELGWPFDVSQLQAYLEG